MTMASGTADQETGLDDYAKDGTVDRKGNPVLRSKTGRWKACSFIIVYELIERMTFYGISTNLIIYLTTKLNQGTVTASNNVTNWIGTVWIAPIFGAYIADAHLGRYRTFLIFSILCLMTMCLLTVAVSIPSLKPPPCNLEDKQNCKQASKLQLAVFFGSLYLFAITSGGTKSNISTMGADQFDDFNPKEKSQKLSFFDWWLFSVFSGVLFASTILVYIQDNVGWSLGYGLPTIGLGVAIFIFLVGSPFYRHKLPDGSPFTTITNVIVAAAWNWRLPLPNHPNQLYELDLQHYSNNGTFKIDSTPSLRFLNKAAIRRDSDDSWRMCTVTKVEETKQMLRMIPIMICTFIPSTIIAQSQTLFIKQGTTLDRTIIGSHFKVPPVSLYAFVTISMLLTIIIYDRVFVKIMKRVTQNPRGITMLQRMRIGMFCYVLVMTVASQVEKHRVDIATKKESLETEEKVVPLSIFILVPQFMLTGVADSFILIASNELFYDQAPENMKSMGSSYTMTSLGIGNFLSSFILSEVSKITKRYGKGWILNNLNDSHLDYFYTLLAVMSGVNLLLFLVISKFYVTKLKSLIQLNCLLMNSRKRRNQKLKNKAKI